MLLKKDNKYCMGTIIPSAPNEGLISLYGLSYQLMICFYGLH